MTSSGRSFHIHHLSFGYCRYLRRPPLRDYHYDQVIDQHKEDFNPDNLRDFIDMFLLEVPPLEFRISVVSIAANMAKRHLLVCGWNEVFLFSSIAKW